MQTLEQCLARLVNAGAISLDEALSEVHRPDDVAGEAKVPQQRASSQADLEAISGGGGLRVARQAPSLNGGRPWRRRR
jgi:hypothetical protein